MRPNVKIFYFYFKLNICDLGSSSWLFWALISAPTTSFVYALQLQFFLSLPLDDLETMCHSEVSLIHLLIILRSYINHPDFQFPHLCNGVNTSIYLIRLLYRWHVI